MVQFLGSNVWQGTSLLVIGPDGGGQVVLVMMRCVWLMAVCSQWCGEVDMSQWKRCSVTGGHE